MQETPVMYARDREIDMCVYMLQGDSGGPLLVTVQNQVILIGITSWGEDGCASFTKYGVYTRVAHYSSALNAIAGMYFIISLSVYVSLSFYLSTCVSVWNSLFFCDVSQLRSGYW